jgi:inner membrane protein
VDLLTHALLLSLILTMLGRPELFLFGIAGAVAPDMDIFFPRFFDRHPRFYVFTHGGVTHSIPGAVVISVFLTPALVLLAEFVPSHPGVMTVSWLAAFTAVLAGALLHVSMDFLAYPGIPVLFPVTDRKFTIGIFAGPNLFIMAASVFYVMMILSGAAGLSDYAPYAVFFFAVLGFGTVLKFFVKIRVNGRTIPTLNPFRWLVIHETADAYSVSVHTLFREEVSPRVFSKFTGIAPSEIRQYEMLPELKRLRYHSYITTVERTGSSIIFRDPFREEGFTWYPPYYANLRIADGTVP